MKTKILELQKILEDSEKALVIEMGKIYPEGSEIEFFIKFGQKNPSSGTVVHHSPRGYVRVKHHQAKERSRYSYRDIYLSQIL
jgi:hypothetical protein